MIEFLRSNIVVESERLLHITGDHEPIRPELDYTNTKDNTSSENRAKLILSTYVAISLSSLHVHE